MTDVERNRRWRENVNKCRQEAAILPARQKQNVRARARQAARDNLPYQTKLPMFGGIAAAVYAAEGKSRKAMEQADRAHGTAVSAHIAAESANEAADKAKEDAADARTMAIENRKRITSLAGEVAETSARAMRNQERLDTDDRQRGYVTPKQRL